MAHVNPAAFAILAIAAGALAQDPGRFADLTLDAARERAKERGRAVLVDFSTPGCEPCRRLLSTWTDPAVAEWLDGNAVAIRVDPERDQDLAKRHRIDAYPTVVLLRVDGTEVGRVVGYRPPVEMLDALGVVMTSESTKWKERSQMADRLVGEGDQAGALRHYLWCWDHGLEKNPSFTGVRVSFLLSKIAELAKTFPPARQALAERRDAAEQRVLAGQCDLAVVSDMTRLNEVLGDVERSLKTFGAVPARRWVGNEIARGVLFESVLPHLHEAKRYADLLRLCGNPEQSLDGELRMLAEAKAIVGAQFAAQKRQEIFRRTACIIEARYGVKDDKAALALAERLLELDGGASTWLLLIEAAGRSGNAVAANEWAVRALKELPAEEQEPIRTALRKK